MSAGMVCRPARSSRATNGMVFQTSASTAKNQVVAGVDRKP